MLTIIKKNKEVSNEDISMLKKKKKRSLNNSKKTDKLKIYLSSSYSSNMITNNSITKNTVKDTTLTEKIEKEHTVIKHTVKEEITCNNIKTIMQDPLNKTQITSDNGKDQKIVEFYMECLERHKSELNKNKLTVWMQVGSFFEVYGLIYPDGKRQGNVWDVAADLDIKVANKKQSVYDNTDIKVYMAGAKEEYAEPYLETLIDKYGWTVAVYTQEKINNSNKIVRVLKKILSPGINFESDNITNNYVYIYFKSNANRLTGKVSLHIGIFYVDCISGENGIQELYARDILDCNVVLSEVIKLITIKNPSELIIHMDIDNYEIYNHLSRDECYSVFGLFNRNVNFIVNECPTEFYNVAHQKLLLENVYHAYMSRGNIFDNLGLNNQNIYGRVVLCLGINNIFQHDSSIIAYLEKPTILKGDMSYLMLANNCLQQLDIISSDANNKVSMLDNTSSIDTDNNILNNISSCNFNTKKKSLLDILDKTKTVMGRRLFKSRLSMPIINKQKLETCYQEIADMQALHNNYLVSTVNPDYALSPYNKIRSHLGDINDISKILRKIITDKAFPNDIVTLYDSINAFTQLHSYIKKNIEQLDSCNSIKLLDVVEIEECSRMLNSIKSMFEFENCINHWALFNNSFFTKGVNANVDTLQDELFKDRDFFLLFKKELTIIINPNTKDLLYNPNLDPDKLSSLLEINEGSNAKLNRYVYCNEKNMNKILSHIKQNPSSCIKIGNYNIKLEMIKFSLLRKGIYHINTPYIDIASRNYVSNLDELKKLCISEFKKWCKSFYLANNMNITKYIKWISTIDVIQSCAIIADKYGYTRPEIYNNYHNKFTFNTNNNLNNDNDNDAGSNNDNDDVNDDNNTDINNDNNTDINNDNKSFIKIDGLRHPIIERYLKDTKYIANDVCLGYEEEQDGILLFGLNAAGKSSLAKSIGIAIIMAQAGMYVACNKMRYKPYNYLFTRIRNNDDIYAGLSSFEVEMKEFKVILDYANSSSLILGDELCSGTETLDATALMASGLNQLSARRASFIFATHLHFLTELECVNNLANLKYYHLAVKQDIGNMDRLIYERKLKPGNGPQSYGILVCKSMKLDNEFVRMAEIIRNQIEAGEVLKFNNRLSSNSIDITTKKVSKYNNDKLFHNCEVCDLKGEDIHHINMQCSSDNKGIIESDNGKFHKNEKWNLVCLCKSCHNDVHKSEPKLQINGYKETSTGYELEFVYLDTNIKTDNVDYNNIVLDTDKEKDDIADNVTDDISDDVTDDITDDDNLRLNDILRLFNDGKSIRSIQYSIRNKYGYKLKLKEIETIISNT